MTIIEQERKERLEEIFRQIEFMLGNDDLPSSLMDDVSVARDYIQSALEGIDSEASNGQS